MNAIFETIIKVLGGEIPQGPAVQITPVQIAPSEISTLCAPLNLLNVYFFDNQYWVIPFDQWEQVFDDVLTNNPTYVPEKFDCEDFAFLTMVDIAKRYEINACGVAVGFSPLGYHGFNVFIAQEPQGLKLHILEPQTGKIDPQGYQPQIIFWS